MERRSNARYEIWLPVRIDGVKEGYAVSHNASKTGMMIVTATKPAVGTAIRLAFKLPPDARRMHEISGKVVRSSVNEKDPHGLWPFAVAVEFAEAVEDLESLLRATDSPAKSRPAPGPPSSSAPTKRST